MRKTHEILLALVLTACGERRAAPTPAHTAIGGESVARVGGVDLSASLVGSVAAARGVAAKVALGLLVDDVVAAKGAEARGLGQDPAASLERTASLARATVDRVAAEARATPPTDAEVRALSEAHWVTVDSPETFVVVHAVVVRPKTSDVALETAAKAVASAIAATEADATDPKDFKTRAAAVPHGKAEVVVEDLEPFTADGRIAVEGSESGYDPRFTAGAATLRTPGATSGVVESSAGWHVIRLIERRPPVFMSPDARRARFASEVFTRRAGEAVQAIENARRASEGASVANGLDDLLALAVPTRPEPTTAPATQ